MPNRYYGLGICIQDFHQHNVLSIDQNYKSILIKLISQF